MIRDKFKELMINKNRIDSLYEAEKNNFKWQFWMMDYRITKLKSKYCMFQQRSTYRKWICIALWSVKRKSIFLKNSDIIIINGSTNKEFEEHILEINSN